MSTIYLHIGPPKTGTTTIQNFLGNNRAALEAHNICFPDLGHKYRGMNCFRNGHFLVKWTPYEGQEISHFEEGFDKLQALAERFGSIILSDEGLWKDGAHMEGFWTKLSEELKKRQMDLRVIVYLRRQDLWIQSFYAQKIKAGRTSLNFEDYLGSLKKDFYPMDYCAYMDMLSDLFGKEALIIRIMEKAQFHGPEHSLISDFLDIFGLTLSDGFTLEEEVSNVKFNGTYLELKRMLNNLPWFQGNKSEAFIGALTRVQALNPFQYDLGRHSFFSPGHQKLFRDSFAESNSRLAREYLGRGDGVLFLEGENDPATMTVNERDLFHDTILVYGTVLQDMKKRNAHQDQVILELQKKVDSLSQEVYELKNGRVLGLLKSGLRKAQKHLQTSPHST